MKHTIRLIASILFLLMSLYIVFVETEKYESTSIIILKDLTQKQEVNLGEMLLGKSSSTLQDSRIIELYMRSSEMYDFLDKKYLLTAHYSSAELDPKQRLYTDTLLPMHQVTNKNLLEKFNADLNIVYDDPSGTLTVSFIHTNPVVAKNILESMYARADEIINDFAKENAKVALQFIEDIRKENRKEFIVSIKKLIVYQNEHHTIDPSLDVERKSTILAELESELIKSEVDYSSKLKSWNPKGKEMQMLKETIRTLQKSISMVKRQMVGLNKEELNKNVFDFELLKSDMEFTKEVYRQTLINQEKLKLEVNQKSRHLLVVSKPSLADSYTYPNKLWDIFTLFIIFIFIYSIITTILTIIKDHKD